MNAIQTLLLPKHRVFYTYFNEAAVTIGQMSVLLTDMCKTTDFDIRMNKSSQIQDLELKNDDLTHKIFNDLCRIYLTSISREDIYELGGQLDDVADCILACSRSITPIKMEKMGSSKLLMAQCIQKMTISMKSLTNSLEKKEHDAMLMKVDEIRLLEREADDLYDHGMKYLYENEEDFKDFIRSREVLMALEKTADACGAVANSIDNIIWKHMA